MLDDITRGENAKQLLENELYVDAIEKVKTGLIASMANSALGDAETHNRLVIALQLLGQITKAIEDVVVSGQMAEIQTKDKRRGFKVFG